MAEYSRLASGQVLSNGGATAVNLPFIPNFIEIYNSNRAVAASGVTSASWMTDMGQGAAFIETTSAGPATGSSFVTVGGFSTFQAGIALQFGPVYQFTNIGAPTFSISLANPAVVTTSVPHGLVTGDVVVFSNLYQTASTGMQQIAGIPFVVTVLSGTTFSIPWNTAQMNYTAYNSATSTGNVGSWKQLLYPNLYAPNLGFISALTLGATTTVTTTAPTNIQVGQEVAFRIPPIWGTTQLNPLPNVLIPGSPFYGFVTAVNSSTQFVVNINSSSYTAFNTNQPVGAALAGGFTVPQVLGVGDANSGSNQLNFLPPSFYNGATAGAVSSINGPAIAGAFCNNTSMGFIIGPAVAGTLGDSLFWRAYMHDLSL